MRSAGGIDIHRIDVGARRSEEIGRVSVVTADRIEAVDAVAHRTSRRSDLYNVPQSEFADKRAGDHEIGIGLAALMNLLVEGQLGTKIKRDHRACEDLPDEFAGSEGQILRRKARYHANTDEAAKLRSVDPFRDRNDSGARCEDRRL
jgi:hypothetical protein